MSSNESGPPDGGSAGPAVGGPRGLSVYDYSDGLSHAAEPGMVPVFSYDEVEEILDGARKKVAATTHRVKHSALDDLRREVLERLGASLDAKRIASEIRNPVRFPRG